MAANQSGKKIRVFLPPRARNIVFCSGQFCLNCIEGAAIDDRRMFSRENFVMVDDFTDIKTVAQNPVHLFGIAEPFPVHRPEIIQIGKIVLVASGQIKRENFLYQFGILRNDFRSVFFSRFAPVSDREFSPGYFPLLREPAELCADALRGHFPFQLRDRDRLGEVKARHCAGRGKITLPDRDEPQPGIPQFFEKRRGIGKITGKPVELPDAACFLGSSVRVTAKKNKMRTESSARFEKELDPNNAMPALQRACELVELLGAGDVVDGIIDCYPTHKPEVKIPFEVERMNKFLGVELTREYMVDILEKLECRIEDDMIIPPSFRGDLNLMSDIAEEIIRIW